MGATATGNDSLLLLPVAALTDNRFRIHITGLEESHLMESLQKIANRISTGVIAAALIIGAALVMRVPSPTRLFGYPAIALVLFLLAAGIGIALRGRTGGRSTAGRFGRRGGSCCPRHWRLYADRCRSGYSGRRRQRSQRLRLRPHAPPAGAWSEAR